MTRILVSGAGIGGLTSAVALAQAGLEVELVDRAPALLEVGAGLQLSPNATAALSHLGLLEAIQARAVRPEAVRVRRGWDGVELARLPLGRVAEARYGAPFLLIHRADLQAALLDAVRAHPAIRIATGASVDGFFEVGEGIEVAVRGGGIARTIAADALVGADGLGSHIRAAFNRRGADERIFCGRTAWRALVPATAAPPSARLPFSNLWLGRKAHLVHYPVRGGTLVNVVAIVEDAWQGDAAGHLWSMPGEAARLLRLFENWAGEARALLETAPEWRIWPLFDRAPLPGWSRGRVTLVGDAAHPMLPFLAQGASQSIEDGWALGNALRREADPAAAFRLYEQRRRPKAHRAQRESRRQGRIYHLGGPGAALRDTALRLLGPERMLSRYDWLYRLAPATPG